MTLPNIDLAEAVDGKDGYLTYKATWFEHGASVNLARNAR